MPEPSHKHSAPRSRQAAAGTSNRRQLPSLRLADYVLGWTTPEKCGLRAVCLDCGSHNVQHPNIKQCRPDQHVCNALGREDVPNNADVASRPSLEIAVAMLEFLEIKGRWEWEPRQRVAAAYEQAVRHFAETDELEIRANAHLSQFAQYRHLAGRREDRLCLDITISRSGLLLVVLELKTTIRSDRARGAIRNLTSTLTEHSGANVPIAAVVTSEPLPSRLLAVAPHRGDTHKLYHVARRALVHAVEAVASPAQLADWRDADKYVNDFNELFLYVRTKAAS
jgi:NgoMIV restriction enzyme